MSSYYEQKDINEDLVDYKALYEEKAKELEQFAYIVSHDLQAPLKNLTVFTQLLKVDNEDKLTEESLTLIKYMNDSVGQVMSQIQILLKYTRIGSGAVKEELDLNDILQKVERQLAGQIQEVDAQVNYEKLPNVYGMASELHLLFECLLHNSLKFSNPSHRPVINIAYSCKGSHWEFRVIDNGIGIDASQHEKIFGMFQNGHVEKKYRGTGAGLAYCKKIIELHGGKIHVQSEVMKGSTFVFTLAK